MDNVEELFHIQICLAYAAQTSEEAIKLSPPKDNGLDVPSKGLYLSIISSTKLSLFQLSI